MRTTHGALPIMLAVLSAVAANGEDMGDLPRLPYEELVQRLEAVEAQLATQANESPTSGLSNIDTSDYCDLGPDDFGCPPKPAASYPTFNANGFFHLDAGFFSQDAASKATLGNIGNGPWFPPGPALGVGTGLGRDVLHDGSMTSPNLRRGSPTSGCSLPRPLLADSA